MIYLSENWVTQKTDESKLVHERISIGIGFIIYFLHREIRCRQDPEKKYLKLALNGIMSTIFVIVLKKYPKDHEHASTDSASAKAISIILNKLFEKDDKTLLFIRNDFETHQSKNYGEIADYLTSDQCHDFFEESSKFKIVKKEYLRSEYHDIITSERHVHAKRIKDDQDTIDYQEKKKFQEINDEIMKDERKIKTNDENEKKQNIIWIDNKQRIMKKYLRKMYEEAFTWRGIWRNKIMFDEKPENVPVKVLNLVTKSLSKPILETRVSHDLIFYNEEDTERIIRNKYDGYEDDNWYLMN